MKTYKIVFQPKSSAVTSFQADTLWGSFCWALRYLKGEKKLENLIELYQNQKPPLIISDGIPEGYLPRPILKPVSYGKAKELAEKYFGETKKALVQGLTTIKEKRKQRYLPIEIFDELKQGFSEERLLDKLLGLKETLPNIKSTLVFRNTINRLTGTVLTEGGLHPDEEVFYGEGIKINIFVKTNLFNLQQLKDIFEFIALSGFGRSASSGKGALELIDCREETVSFSVSDVNAFMSLSSFVPNDSDPIQGYYQLITKWGKLGGDYAKSEIPFKKPLIMFSAGSVFFDTPIREYYGRLIEGIHYNLKIKHYGFVFPIGVRVDEDI